MMDNETFRRFSDFAPYIIEFIGTFFLSLSVGLNVAQQTQFPPISIGLCLMAMIYMGGHISGGHYNPSVTLGVLLRGGKISPLKALGYFITQLCSGFIGALICWLMTGNTQFSPNPHMNSSILATVLAEFFYTFALVFVVLQTATTQAMKDNPIYGFAIGAVVVAGASSVGGISGAGFNPAVALGAHLVDVLDPSATHTIKYIWIYWLGPLLASCLAALVFRITNREEYIEELGEATPLRSYDDDKN